MSRHGMAVSRPLIIMILGAGLVAGACSGPSAPSQATAAPLASSSAAAEGTTTPTDPPADGSALPSDPPASASAVSFDPAIDICAPFEGSAEPPPTADVTALLERFPETVDGQPVSDPKAHQAMQVFCSGADDGNVLAEVIAQEFGVDLRTAVLGNFGAIVDSSFTLVEVIRVPGQDGNAALPAFAALGGAIDPGQGTMANVGGKDVKVLDLGNAKRYQFVDGDTIWAFMAETDAQAATMIAELAG